MATKVPSQDSLSEEIEAAKLLAIQLFKQDPTGYLVSSAVLRRVINESDDVLEETKISVWEILDGTVIKGDDLADAFHIGFAMAHAGNILADKAGVEKILNNIRDIDKLPFVSIKGKPVLQEI